MSRQFALVPLNGHFMFRLAFKGLFQSSKGRVTVVLSNWNDFGPIGLNKYGYRRHATCFVSKLI